MITYLVTGRHAYTIRTFMQLWGSRAGLPVRVMSYEYLLCRSSFESGAYIFSDIERVDSESRERLLGIWKLLSDEGRCTILNNPASTMRRFQLLQTLSAEGFNEYSVYRASDGQMPVKYPVYIRNENDHSGNLTTLIYNEEGLVSVLKKYPVRKLMNKLIIEFCSTADSNGMFRKYSAFIVGNMIIPQHIMFGRHWMLKSASDLPVTESQIIEEYDYVISNPHESMLREIFGLAGVSYGRIDYAMLDGRIQTWEINTNPVIIGTGAISTGRLKTREYFLARMYEAFRAVDSSNVATVRVDSGRSDGLGIFFLRGFRLFTDVFYALLFRTYITIKRLIYGTEIGPG